MKGLMPPLYYGMYIVRLTVLIQSGQLYRTLRCISERTILQSSQYSIIYPELFKIVHKSSETSSCRRFCECHFLNYGSCTSGCGLVDQTNPGSEF